MRVHIVQKGDTLWKIAKQYAIGFEDLKRLNAHLANPDYIVPGMEIYLPDSVQKKEVQQVVKEQPKPVKELPKPVKEQPVQMPAPMPQPQPQKPLWQGDIYLQPTPQPMPMPMPMPNWQTNVHVQPTFENNITQPQAQPVYLPPQQPMIIQQPPQPQPQPQFMHPMPMPQMPQMPVCPSCHRMPMEMTMHHMPVCPSCHRMPVESPMHMHQMPVCSSCQRMPMESTMYMHPQMQHMHMEHPMHPQMQPYMHMEHPMHMQMQPIYQEESSVKREHCPDKEHLVNHYYNEIDYMMHQQNPCCHPQMMPYPASMMPQMQPMPQPPKSCQ